MTGYFRETHPVETRLLNDVDVLGGAVACADTIVKRIDVIRGKGSIMSSVARSLLVNENSRCAEGTGLQPLTGRDCSTKLYGHYSCILTNPIK